MKVSLKWKLIVTFLATIALVIGLVSILANVILEKQFRNYVLQKLSNNNMEIVSTLEKRYEAWGNKWSVDGVENIGMSALSDGLMLRVYNQEERLIWDAMTHNRGMCASILQHMSENMQGRNSDFNGGYIEQKHPILNKGRQIGIVAIGYYGPYYYTDNDIEFLNKLNYLLFIVTLISGIVAIIIATFLSNRISSPISRVIRAAGQIAEGNYKDRIVEDSNTKEITHLTEAINSLANSLEHQEMIRKRMNADVAHELRTPLACVQSHLEAMMDGIWDPTKERLESCHEETVRISKMVSDLEKLARYDGETITLNKERFLVKDLIQRILKNFEKEFVSKHINLVTELDDIYLNADQDKIAQVFINLISNAVKYSAKGDTIKIIVTESKEHSIVIVSDTGSGISAEDIPFIFERFYRADQSRTRMTGGSGIGLAITKSLVNAHGGSIEVQSQLGKGSVFKIKFPK